MENGPKTNVSSIAEVISDGDEVYVVDTALVRPLSLIVRLDVNQEAA